MPAPTFDIIQSSFLGESRRPSGAALSHSNSETAERYTHVVDHEVVTVPDKLPDIATPMQKPERALLSNVPMQRKISSFAALYAIQRGNYNNLRVI
jgi:hypothetical protein